MAETAGNAPAAPALSALADFLIEAERLKLVPRLAYVSDFSRRENSAEHSWHLALALLALAREMQLPIDLDRALRMALVHDLCEIDAGDTPAYGAPRPDQHAAERACIERLASHAITFGPELRELWLEYEAQQTVESRWVRVLDRVTPFLVNLATRGRNWQEQGVSRSQLLRVCEPVERHAPEVFQWMCSRIDDCVAQGWLRDA